MESRDFQCSKASDTTDMAKQSLRGKLRHLVVKHPDWSNQQYADHLGQSVDSVRGALSAMGLSRRYYKQEKKRKEEPPKTKIKSPRELPKPIDNMTDVRVASSTRSSNQTGYFKLL